MKKLLLSLVLLFTFSMSSWSQVTDKAYDKAYEEAMVKMLEVSKSMDAMKQMAPQIIALIKQQAPDAPQEFWNGLETAMLTMYDKMLKAFIPVYKKHLTLEDIQGIIKFYETPIGKKLASTNIVIATESMPIAQKIAMETMQALIKDATEKGYIKK